MLLTAIPAGLFAQEECAAIRIHTVGKASASSRTDLPAADEPRTPDAEIQTAPETTRGNGPLEKKPPKRRRFSTTRFLDLEFRVRFSQELQGDHLLRLELLTPKGHRYETLTAPISTDPEMKGATRKVANYPRPLQVQHVGSRGYLRSRRAVLRLPVAGTSIVSNSLYGPWRVDAYLDDAADACSTRSFILKP